MKQVTILALVILLAITITSAKKVLKVVSGETTIEPDPVCQPDMSWPCHQDSDCCSNNCIYQWAAGASYHVCAPPKPCRKYLKGCFEDKQCCSGQCKEFLFMQYCSKETDSD